MLRGNIPQLGRDEYILSWNIRRIDCASNSFLVTCAPPTQSYYQTRRCQFIRDEVRTIPCGLLEAATHSVR